MDTPINFELAKLLKEKGFVFRQNETYYNPVNGFTKYEEVTSTIAEVVMWLYEKHSLWMLALPTVTGYFAYKIVDVQIDPENEIERPPYKDVSANDYNSPTEAYEAAIEYCLTNLIKEHGKEKM